MAKPIAGQTEIPVPDSPGAIGRWTLDDQFSAYAKEKGVEKAIEQKKAADLATECNCGEQAKEDVAARQEERAPRAVKSHKAGCPKYRPAAKGAVRISNDEQAARMNASKLRSAVERSREEGSS